MSILWLSRMMQLLFLMLCLTAASPAMAQADNETPLYGSRQKTPEQLEADRRFIETVTQGGVSRAEAARQVMEQGWQAHRSGDNATAIRRFNQAYLLVPQSVEPYWALAIVESSTGHLGMAVQLFERAEKISPKNHELLTDFAVAYMAGVQNPNWPADAKPTLAARSDKLFSRALALNSRYAPAYANRAVLRFLASDFQSAWKDVIKAQSIKADSVDPSFLAELEKRMPRPGKA